MATAFRLIGFAAMGVFLASQGFALVSWQFWAGMVITVVVQIASAEEAKSRNR